MTPTMSDQFSLPGFDDALPKKPLIDQIFFAVRPDEETAARIAEIVRRLCLEHGLRGKPLPPERLHVTLRGLGGYDGTSQDVVVAAKDAAAAIAMPPFNVAFNSIMSFGAEKESARWSCAEMTVWPVFLNFSGRLAWR